MMLSNISAHVTKTTRRKNPYNYERIFSDEAELARFVKENRWMLTKTMHRVMKGGLARYYYCKATKWTDVKCKHMMLVVKEENGFIIGKTTDGGLPHEHGDQKTPKRGRQKKTDVEKAVIKKVETNKNYWTDSTFNSELTSESFLNINRSPNSSKIMSALTSTPLGKTKNNERSVARTLDFTSESTATEMSGFTEEESGLETTRDTLGYATEFDSLDDSVMSKSAMSSTLLSDNRSESSNLELVTTVEKLELEKLLESDDGHLLKKFMETFERKKRKAEQYDQNFSNDILLKHFEDFLDVHEKAYVKENGLLNISYSASLHEAFEKRKLRLEEMYENGLTKRKKMFENFSLTKQRSILQAILVQCDNFSTA